MSKSADAAGVKASPSLPLKDRRQNKAVSRTPEWERLQLLMQRPIAFQPVLARIAGGALPGLFLSQAFYWSQRTTDPDGWFYKTRDEWNEETCMTRYEQETARKQLVSLGLMEEERRGLPARMYYRLRSGAILAAIDAFSQNHSGGGNPTNKLVENQPTGLVETSKQVGRKAANKYKDAENTAKNTAETTTTRARETFADSANGAAPAASDVVVASFETFSVDATTATLSNGAMLHEPSLRERMLAVGVSPGAIPGLLAKGTPERIALQLDCLPDRHPEDPAKMLVKAIREDWAPPAAYVQRLQAESDARQSATRAAALKLEQDAENARQAQAAATAAQRAGELDAIYGECRRCSSSASMSWCAPGWKPVISTAPAWLRAN
jgi:hypothetical protein